MKSEPLDVAASIRQLGQRAREAGRVLAAADTNAKNAALLAIADALQDAGASLQRENKLDMDAGRERNLDAALLDRLELNDSRIQGMANGLRQVASLPDPVGEITDMRYRPSGLQVGKMRVPLGVIGIIYESRPNVTADAAAICLKSGNASILRGGSEALHSNVAIASCLAQGLEHSGLPSAAVSVVGTTDRAAVGALITLTDYVDVIVPRGGKGLIQRISADAKVPVIKHLDGICHTYIDDEADIDKAIAVAFNAKTYRYGICGAMETLLVSSAIAADVLPPLAAQLRAQGVELRACEQARAHLPDATAATEEDWATEYLDAVLSIRQVDDMDAAMEHIARFGSGHTDAIITENLSRARRFMREVDSSSVMVNAATCFADGFEYGLGAEIGISTDRLHVRGPVGVEGLTSQKYVVIGDGTTR